MKKKLLITIFTLGLLSGSAIAEPNLSELNLNNGYQAIISNNEHVQAILRQQEERITQLEKAVKTLIEINQEMQVVKDVLEQKLINNFEVDHALLDKLDKLKK